MVGCCSSRKQDCAGGRSMWMTLSNIPIASRFARDRQALPIAEFASNLGISPICDRHAGNDADFRGKGENVAVADADGELRMGRLAGSRSGPFREAGGLRRRGPL